MPTSSFFAPFASNLSTLASWSPTPLALAIFLFSVLALQRWSSRRRLKLPPSPPGLPVAGNWLDVSVAPQEDYLRWGKEYDSEIISINVFGTRIIVLNTTNAAAEILDRRGAIYSARAPTPIITELMGMDWNTLFLGYSDTLRTHRRYLRQSFGLAAVSKFRPHMQRASGRLLDSLFQTPLEFRSLIEHMTASFSIDVTYGIQVQPKNDPLVERLETVLLYILAASTPGNFLVDSIPLLKHVPSWFPGASFQRTLRKWRKETESVVLDPFKIARSDFEQGKPTDSFVSAGLRALDTGIDDPEKLRAVQGTAATLYLAATDTTKATILGIIFSLAANPDVQGKAQAEIDRVVRDGTLPSFEDADAMPYIQAIIMEGTRIHAATAIGVPHYSTQDDEYEGYLIPAETIIVANQWAMLHDPLDYPDPFTFNPERFMKNGRLDESVRDPRSISFGFGRRRCPGRHLADELVWLVVASLLKSFAFKQVGKEPLIPSYSVGLIRTIEPFKCDVQPRSGNPQKGSPSNV